jgi:methylase of polypeptide subunit release factors
MTAKTVAAGPGVVGADAALTPADAALVALGRELLATGYRFTTITPASHWRVNRREENGLATTLDGVFGWSRPYREGVLSRGMTELLSAAGALDIQGYARRSKVRFSTLGDQLYVHSAFPTDASDAVFFGPDTYRFCRTVGASLDRPAMGGRCRLIDIGAGAGAGGIYGAALLSKAVEVELVLTDINPEALRLCRVNAALNGITRTTTVESDVLKSVDGKFDLIIANPPYLVDRLARMYRHGGGPLGYALSQRIVEEAMPRLAPGGRLILYTGSAIVDGTDQFREALKPALGKQPCTFTYEEIDPDVFGEELGHPPYDRADRIATVAVIVDVP